MKAIDATVSSRIVSLNATDEELKGVDASLSSKIDAIVVLIDALNTTIQVLTNRAVSPPKCLSPRW